MKLFVVGAGEMGRWLARTLAPALDGVAFADVDPAAAEAATAAVAAPGDDDTTPDGPAADDSDDPVAAGGSPDARTVPLDTDETFDCVALAVPIPAVPDAVEAHAANAATGALVDVSGAMTDPLAAMAEHAEAEYASFHPLFAPPRAPGRVAYVPGEVGAVVEAVRDALRGAGNDVFETTAGEHDGAMATVQTGAHTAVLAYALAAADVREEFHTPVSEPLAELARTVTEGDPGVYADIREAFGGAEAVAEAARELAEADRGEFADQFERARERAGAERRGGRGGNEPPDGRRGADPTGESGDGPRGDR
ncbi:prephenate dehydrogenase/arogenate dehydrogenase family protein [Halorarum salinum]|uniref:Prephenate dehydrogenase/arogenate dehydrogenase family protein n=1 Tax=Halorarum salinum TaxID=2743089 RepID=A0A7D5QKP5_9EURY|nr:prephenate dehydrogenase/arogenate dehydrogenase family protein [Halobaculum salinum]QLG62265.1 prephenate dehydrogenase/arogenate dehydrogenase family protein [Halobaculum salinum]